MKNKETKPKQKKRTDIKVFTFLAAVSPELAKKN